MSRLQVRKDTKLKENFISPNTEMITDETISQPDEITARLVNLAKYCTPPPEFLERTEKPAQIEKTFIVVFDTVGYTNKPKGNQVGGIKQRLANGITQITLKDFIKSVKRGCTFVPAEVNGEQVSENWKSQQIFCVDIDNKTDPKSPDYMLPQKALDICRTNNINPFFLYHTFSSTQEVEKYRICFVLDRLITDTSEREKIITTLIDLFKPVSDPACKDPARLFFAGRAECSIFEDLQAVTSANTILEISKKKQALSSPELPEKILSKGFKTDYSSQAHNLDWAKEFEADPDQLLLFIDPVALSYDEWVKVSASYKVACNGSFELWRDWNISSSKWNEKTDTKTWKSLDGKGITEGTLKFFAQQTSAGRQYMNNLRQGMEQAKQDYKSKHNLKSTAVKSAENKAIRSNRPVLNLNNFRHWLTEKGYFIGYDLVTHDPIYKGFEHIGIHKHLLPNNLPTFLEQELETEFEKATVAKIERYISAVSAENAINPVFDRIKMTKWDGIDRIQQIYNIFGIEANDTLSRLLIKKWLMQAVALLQNGDSSAYFTPEFVLVLQGSQGIGKTTFFEHLCIMPEYWGGGLSINPDNKDSVKQATTKWIAELGEIGSTMKRDMDSLKAFITSSYDEYREPYERKAVKYPRKTCFLGTVNDTEYLIDPTGSRRWATIPLRPDLRIDYDTQTKTFNSLQLWAQVWEIVQSAIANGETLANCFRLTHQELIASERRNAEHNKPLKGELEVIDVIANIKSHGFTMQDITVTEFIQQNLVLTKYNTAIIAKVLNKLGYTQTIKKHGGTTLRLRKLPVRCFSQTN